MPLKDSLDCTVDRDLLVVPRRCAGNVIGRRKPTFRLHTGMRPKEQYALTRDKVDLVRKLVTNEKQVPDEQASDTLYPAKRGCARGI